MPIRIDAIEEYGIYSFPRSLHGNLM